MTTDPDRRNSEAMISRQSTDEGEAERRNRQTRAALAEFEAGRLVDGDEVLAWIDRWGADDEPDPRFAVMPRPDW
jgi:predicted transcriptional regulator